MKDKEGKEGWSRPAEKRKKSRRSLARDHGGPYLQTSRDIATGCVAARRAGTRRATAPAFLRFRLTLKGWHLRRISRGRLEFPRKLRSLFINLARGEKARAFDLFFRSEGAGIKLNQIPAECGLALTFSAGIPIVQLFLPESLPFVSLPLLGQPIRRSTRKLRSLISKHKSVAAFIRAQ